MSRIARALLLAPLFAAPLAAQAPASAPPALASQVEVLRTTHGVPHIRAQNLKAAAYALAYVQLEDYGPRVAYALVRAQGQMGRWFGHDSIDGDFPARLAHDIAVRQYSTLDQNTRDVYEGFAAGANRYVELHPEEFLPGFNPQFTGYDVAAKDVELPSPTAARRFLARMEPETPRRARRPPPSNEPPEGYPDDAPDYGSNAWAFAPSRTKSGRAILMRNPHLSWDAGYYEAQITVPNVLEWYGDFRIGGPFSVVGGFNHDLGFATTNNAPDLNAIYALDVDSTKVDAYLFDGTSHQLEHQLVTAEYRNGAGLTSETREMWRTSLGPVIYRGGGKIYVLKAANDGEYRAGEQFLKMMRAKSLAEWKEAMRMRARVNSNFTYADRAGHIFYVWNASIPSLPHPNADDSAAVPAHGSADVWTRYVPWDSLPQVLDPKGGYVQNSNDPPYLTNLHQPLDRARYPENFPDPKLGLRTQMSLQLIDTDRKLSLEDVIALKHSYHMLLADRVKNDLVAAVRASNPAPNVAQAADALAKWDNTVAPTSKGGVVFEIWWRRYIQGSPADSMFAQPWTITEPVSTPRGLRDPARAVAAFTWAVDETTRRFGAADLAWGDVHRVRVGSVDVPVGGCNGDLGCFRVLWFRNEPDGKRAAQGGDGWILAVEFTDTPRAYSILAYGESDRADSPFHDDQAAMFARGELKKVDLTPRDVEAHTVRRYRPGLTR
ncbi:MAG TPA: penicillin acylase family protein [Gemmatimonadaceae bacterium]|nr:penicillin acylase family protein [Gemmatimonadaceae bacterium]